jgi:drug/metabolite transporter (DMT)-like permease
MKSWLLLGLSGFFLALHFILWMESLHYTSIANSTILKSLESVFVMSGAFLLFKERTSSLANFGMLTALVGAVYVAWGDMGLSLPFTGMGIIFLTCNWTYCFWTSCFFNWMLQYVKATTISMCVLGEPIGASILASILFHQKISVFQIAGGIIVIVGLYFYFKSNQILQKAQINLKQQRPEAKS